MKVSETEPDRFARLMVRVNWHFHEETFGMFWIVLVQGIIGCRSKTILSWEQKKV